MALNNKYNGKVNDINPNYFVGVLYFRQKLKQLYNVGINISLFHAWRGQVSASMLKR